MKLADKINSILEKEQISLSELHRKIVLKFENNAIAYATLLRTVNKKTEIRETSLFQIATALGMDTNKLMEGTEKEEKYPIYSIDEKFQYKLFSLKLDFLPMECTIKPGGKGPTEQSDPGKSNYTKWVYGLKGETTIIIMTNKGSEEITLKKGEEYAFNSSFPHCFENRSKKLSICIIVLNPKHL